MVVIVLVVIMIVKRFNLKNIQIVGFMGVIIFIPLFLI